MKALTRMVALFISFGLAGCNGDSLCDSYELIPERDQNLDGEVDYEYQVIGDSILAYHNITCKSVGHQIGLATDERVLTRATTGAKVHEIEEQFQAAIDSESDYEYIFINGGLNDLIAREKVGAPEATPCDCNGDTNHDACVQEVADILSRMNGLIDNVREHSNAEIALVAYYPAETLDSFIGECFPYVEQLNGEYRALAEQHDDIHFVETYGAGLPVIQKVSPFGQDNYHPAPNGSAQIAQQVIEQLDLSDDAHP
ncbi:MAG: GDSL-type esterase/lipase family protein [Pseudomonadales bacterium]|nr:GDSL-type esterase/lipase family protein [Pseudomonadales bacterium]